MKNTLVIAITAGLVCTLVQPGRASEVTVGNFELSGCAMVSGGLLIADDELVGSVLFVSDEELNKNGSAYTASIIKLQRKKKVSKPIGSLDRLVPIQDIEGLASDSNTVFLVGSHAPKDGERRSDREFLIRATFDAQEKEIEAPELADKFIDRLSTALNKAGVNLELTDKNLRNDVNIEGLAYGNKRLYIGFRGPLVDGRLAIMCDANAVGLFDAATEPSINVNQVDLGGRGIRGLEAIDNDAVLILAGPSGEDASKDPAIFRYDVRAKTCRLVYEFTDDDLTACQPEGLAVRDSKCFVVFDADGKKPGMVKTIALDELHN